MSVQVQPDFKPEPRYRASKEEWKRIREVKLDGKRCRICPQPAESLHHLVGRDLGGDDAIRNLVELCGDGTRGCHGMVQVLDRVTCAQLRARLGPSEVAYVVSKKSRRFLDRYYPLEDA